MIIDLEISESERYNEQEKSASVKITEADFV